jgi:hypothetical protein
LTQTPLELQVWFCFVTLIVTEPGSQHTILVMMTRMEPGVQPAARADEVIAMKASSRVALRNAGRKADRRAFNLDMDMSPIKVGRGSYRAPYHYHNLLNNIKQDCSGRDDGGGEPEVTAGAMVGISTTVV